MIVNEYRKYKIEANPEISKRMTRDNLSEELGIGKSTIFNTIKEYQEKKNRKISNTKRHWKNVTTRMDKFDKYAIWSKIYQFRINHKLDIYFLNETWVNTEDVTSTVWTDTTVQSSRAAFSQGFTTGRWFCFWWIDVLFGLKKNTNDYYNETNGNTFHEWLKIVLPRLRHNAVIAMDNNCNHSIKMEKSWYNWMAYKQRGGNRQYDDHLWTIGSC